MAKLGRTKLHPSLKKFVLSQLATLVDQTTQSFPGLEPRHFGRGDPNWLAGLGIYPIAGSTRTDAKCTEAGDGHSLTRRQIAFDGIHQNVHGLGGRLLGHIGFAGD